MGWNGWALWALVVQQKAVHNRSHTHNRCLQLDGSLPAFGTCLWDCTSATCCQPVPLAPTGAAVSPQCQPCPLVALLCLRKLQCRVVGGEGEGRSWNVDCSQLGVAKWWACGDGELLTAATNQRHCSSRGYQRQHYSPASTKRVSSSSPRNPGSAGRSSRSAGPTCSKQDGG